MILLFSELADCYHYKIQNKSASKNMYSLPCYIIKIFSLHLKLFILMTEKAYTEQMFDILIVCYFENAHVKHHYIIDLSLSYLQYHSFKEWCDYKSQGS